MPLIPDSALFQRRLGNLPGYHLPGRRARARLGFQAHCYLRCETMLPIRRADATLHRAAQPSHRARQTAYIWTRCCRCTNSPER
jgi:hypothetical protein